MATAQLNAPVEVVMPRLSDSMEEGAIVQWLVAHGETVDEGQEIVEIETDKATMPYEAPAPGPLWILASAGSTVAVGRQIAQIGGPEPSDDAQDNTHPDLLDTTSPATEVPSPPTTPSAARPPKVSSIARRVAEERNIDLATVAGSGPAGRIVKADVLAAIEAPGGAPGRRSQPTQPAPDSGANSHGSKGETRRVELTRTQAIVARRMAESRATIPDFSVTAEVDMGAVLDLRAQLADSIEPVPTINDFLLAASARMLVEHPKLNASYADGACSFHGQINVGFAVTVEDDLLVPVIAGANWLGLSQLAIESRRLAERVRSRSITPPELSGGTFTVSNLGMFGATSVEPIINQPQVAILGVGGVSAKSGLTTLTLVSDHRVVYGADAARFLAGLRTLLERPLALLLSRV